jgi:hypothetical protein
MQDDEVGDLGCGRQEVIDALGIDAIDLPLTPAKLAALSERSDEPAPPQGRTSEGCERRGTLEMQDDEVGDLGCGRQEVIGEGA